MKIIIIQNLTDMDNTYTFELSISDNSYTSKKDINWSKVTYSNSSINLNLFETLIRNGYNFCYSFQDSHICQSQKTIKNWKNTSCVFVDIDDVTTDLTTFTANLSHFPTISYTTYSNGKDNTYSYRLIYCFNEIINNVDV